MSVMYIPLVFSIIFSIVALMGSYILHKKSKQVSTLLILSGNIFFVISSVLIITGLGFGNTVSSGTWQNITHGASLISGFLAPPLSAIGLLLYAIKLLPLKQST